MSYEGYTEYIDSEGKYIVKDCYEAAPANAVWYHDVDQTNGEDLDDPNTYPAEVEIIGRIDERRIDHKGNEYFIEVARYKPKGEQWRRVHAKK